MLFRIQLPLSIIFLCILAMYFCSFISVLSVFLTPQQTDASVCSISWQCGAGVCIMLSVWRRCLWTVDILMQAFVAFQRPGASRGSISWQCRAVGLACRYFDSSVTNIFTAQCRNSVICLSTTLHVSSYLRCCKWQYYNISSLQLSI